VWPGASLIYYGTGGSLEYDIELAPFADPKVVRLSFEGASGTQITPEGTLELTTDSGILRQLRPVAYQMAGSIKVPVDAAYCRLGPRTIGIRLGKYDRQHAVVIDPVISYASFMIPSGSATVASPVYRMAVDATGNAYVFGTTASTAFPGPSASLGSLHGASDFYVAKLSPTGSLLWATYLGGSGAEAYTGDIAVDSSGNVYVCGTTQSQDFPTTAGALRRSPGAFGVDIGFVSVLNSTGTALAYSTYLGTDDSASEPSGIALGPGNRIYVTGRTFGPNFPVTAGAYVAANSSNNSFLSIIDPSLSGSASLVYSTFVSPSFGPSVSRIAVDAAGIVYLAGNTNGAIPTTPNAYRSTLNYFGDMFVMALDPAKAGSSALTYATYFGGNGSNQGFCGLQIDSAGKLYVAGFTGDLGFPTTPGAYQTTFITGTELFAAKLDRSLSGANSLVYSTFAGVAPNSQSCLAVDQTGGLYLAGTNTSGVGFQSTSDAFQRNFGGGVSDGVVMKLSAGGNALVYGTYLGGSGNDQINAIGLAPNGDVIIAGYTDSHDFPTPGTPAPSSGPDSAGIVVRISGLPSQCTYTVTPSSVSFDAAGGTGVISVTTAAGCAWSAHVNGTFFDITGGQAGSGNGTVSFRVIANSYASRTGTITVAGQDVTITQDEGPLAPKWNLTVTHSNTFKQGGAGTFTITVQNSSANPTLSGPTVVWALPASMVVRTVFAGVGGWYCAAAHCSRADPAAPGAIYDSIYLTVDIAYDAPSQASLVATVENGGASPVTVSHPITIDPEAVIISPVKGSSIAGSTVTFQWTSGAATQFMLWVGNFSVGSRDIFAGSASSNTSATVSGLPTDGRLIYVRFWEMVGGIWQYSDYTYRSAQFFTSGPRADFNLDGVSDVIWQDPVYGIAQFWLLGGVNLNSVIGTVNLTTLNNLWRIVGTGDFDGDGHPDIVWQDPQTGVSQVWFLGGANGNVVTGAATLSGPNAWRIRAVTDFDGDGRPDCIWQDPSSGFAQIWFLGGAHGTDVMGAVNLTATNTWRIVGAADFDKNGTVDVLWQDPITGATQVWYLGGPQHNQITNAVTLTGANAWRVAALADYNGDGYPDTIWQDPNTGASQIFYLGGVTGTTVQSTATLSGPNAWRIAGPR
jgi:hypothetical protein